MKSVCIVCGGQSHEYEISLISASSVLKNINREKHRVHTLIIDKNGNFFHSFLAENVANDEWKNLPDLVPAIISQGENGGVLRLEGGEYKKVEVDVFWPVLHGENGEDGVIQGLFKLSQTAYVGGGVLASASCMDKEITHIRLDAAGIKTAPYLTVRGEFDIDALDCDIKAKLGYPVFVKPANAGSSVGVGKAGDKEALLKALIEALKVDSKVLVEKNIVGAEVECAVLGNENPVAATHLGQIAPTVEFYDFDAKYTDSSTQLYIPARIDGEVAEKIRAEAVKAYKVMGCEGLSRVDFFALENGEFVLNEINNLPGFTSISMYPKLFEAAGVSYSELIDKLIETARLK